MEDKVKKSVIVERENIEKGIQKFSDRINKNKSFINKRRYELLNKNSTAEKHFESLLMDSNINFIREKIHQGVNNLYYSDFYINSLKLNIEIDGKEHLSNVDYDLKKEDKIYTFDNSLTIRYTNSEVTLLDSITIDDMVNRVKSKYKNTFKLRRWLKGLKSNKDSKVDRKNKSSRIHDTMKSSDIVVFAKGICKGNSSFSEIKTEIRIHDNGKLIDVKYSTINNHRYVSSNKADIISIVDTLKYMINCGAENHNIKILSNNKFVIDKLTCYDRFEYDETAIYADCMPELNILIDEFSDLEFEWVPKECNNYILNLDNKK